MPNPTLLDLFCGCGGFSLGAHQAGFDTKVAVDVDPILSGGFAANFPHAKLLHQDVRSIDAATLESLIPTGVDGVIGGPPCQAFSEIGRRASRDPRRRLVREFFRIVDLVRPKFFIFENVPGLGFKRNRHLLDEGVALLRGSWTVLGPVIIDASELGAPTRRLRLFVFGFDRDQVVPPGIDDLSKSAAARVTVRDAIGDLQSARDVGVDERGFDVWQYDGRRIPGDYASSVRSSSLRFTGHRKTQHTVETLKRFAKLEQGDTDKIGKYLRLKWDGLCPTLRAGTGSDRGSYQAVRPIHPSLDRVVTPREAARLQGFPDDFRFHPTVWHSCRMIGNSVSPIVGRVLLERVARALDVPVESRMLAAAE